MTESKWGKVKDNTVPVLLGTLIVALFYTTASTHGRMADMENRRARRPDLHDSRIGSPGWKP